MSILTRLASAFGFRKSDDRNPPKKADSKVMTREERLALANRFNQLTRIAAAKRDECERLKRLRAEGLAKCMSVIGSVQKRKA